MPDRPPPKYRCYKPKNLGVVRIDGRDIYLGRYNSPESLEKYGRVLAEWRATGTAPPAPGTPPAADGMSVTEVMAAFIRYADGYYRRADGTPTEEFAAFKRTLKPLRRLYGSTLAKDFGPLKLKALRQTLIDSGLCRKTINQRIGRIVRMFKWAVSEEHIPASVHHGLRAVAGLRKGRSKAPEHEPVKPVPDAHVDAIRSHVARQVWAMIEIQRLTGMRPGEVTIMRTGDLNVSGDVWEYVPERHKTEHHGKERRIFLGPKAQEALKPWLRENLGEYLFSPAEAMAEKSAARREARKTPLTPSQRARRRKRKPEVAPGDLYLVHSYANVIRRACKAAGVPHWHPNQLRHNAATLLRREFGLDVARIILGHSSPAVTEVYAERDRLKAAEVMRQIG